MTKYGTWTSIPCPNNQVEEAFQFLRVEYAKIGGSVRKVIDKDNIDTFRNISFEVDLPREFENLGDGDDPDVFDDYEKWITRANNIEQAYYDKFEM